MNREVIVTCAVTGAGDTADKHPDLPITPKQIAEAAIGAAKAGAAIVHCHVREPDGALSTVQDRHIEGLFSRAQWLEVLGGVGFEAKPIRFKHTGQNGEETEGFLGIK